MKSTILFKVVIFAIIMRLGCALPTDTDKSEGNLIPCEEGWILYDELCYNLEGNGVTGALSWTGASARCSSLGGKLTSIHSKDQQDFLTLYTALEVKRGVWIGLHDRGYESLYKWDDDSVYDYSNWSPGEPTAHHNTEEDCVEMVFKHPKGKEGQWNDVPCNLELPYVCQKASNSSIKSRDYRFCSEDQGGGWRFRNSCFNIINEPKSWQEAEQHCKDNFHGHLVTIADEEIDKFIEYMTTNFKKEMWLGIKAQNQLQQRWSSGWFVAYNNLNKSPEYPSNDTCVLRARQESWLLSPCSETHPFICEKSKVGPPTLKPAVEGSQCPEPLTDWRDLDGEFCYFFDTKSEVNWHQASENCIKRGGTLASIHSKVESHVLHPFVANTQGSIYVGLNALLSNGERYGWSDGSELDYTHWAKNEPNQKDTEKCGEVLTSDMSWNNILCSETKGYICSIKKVMPNRTSSAESRIHKKGDCPGGPSFISLLGVFVCLLMLVVLLAAVGYYFRGWFSEKRKSFMTVMFKPAAQDEERRNIWSTESTVQESGKE